MEVSLYHQVYCGGGDEDIVEYDIEIGINQGLELVIFPNEHYFDYGTLYFHELINLKDLQLWKKLNALNVEEKHLRDCA